MEILEHAVSLRHPTLHQIFLIRRHVLQKYSKIDLFSIKNILELKTFELKFLININWILKNFC